MIETTAQLTEACAVAVQSLSAWTVAGIPETLVASVFVVLLALALTPLLAGQEIAGLRIPAFKKRSGRIVSAISWFLIAMVVVGYLPLFPKHTGFGAIQPQLLEPSNGATFAHFPRALNLKWQPISDAARYKVDIQAKDTETGDWFPNPAGATHYVQTSVAQVNFVGAQPGRWRVTAVAANGTESSCSAWWSFHFTN